MIMTNTEFFIKYHAFISLPILSYMKWEKRPQSHLRTCFENPRLKTCFQPRNKQKMLCWIASASHCFCDNEHQCHAPQHHKYVPYSFRKPKGNGSYRVKNQNSCKERTSYYFQLLKGVCVPRGTVLSFSQQQCPPHSSVSTHHHPCGHIDLTHTAQDRGSSVESSACVCKVPIPQQEPSSQGLSADAENPRFRILFHLPFPSHPPQLQSRN